MAAFLGDIDPGDNWKAILVGLFLSSNILALNHAGSLAYPEGWPYRHSATVVMVSQMAMWFVFLWGMRRYSPPRPFSYLINHRETFSRGSE